MGEEIIISYGGYYYPGKHYFGKNVIPPCDIGLQSSEKILKRLVLKNINTVPSLSRFVMSLSKIPYQCPLCCTQGRLKCFGGPWSKNVLGPPMTNKLSNLFTCSSVCFCCAVQWCYLLMGKYCKGLFFLCTNYHGN